MATVVASRVTVTDTATALATVAALQHPSDTVSVLIRNLGTASIDIDGAGVTSGAGFPLGAGESVTLDLSGVGYALYGIAAPAGSVAVAVLKVTK